MSHAETDGDATDEEFETIEWSFDERTGIGRVTLARPGKMNALNLRMQDELVEAFEKFRRLDERDEVTDGVAVRAVVIDGAGDRAFSSGLDVEEMEGISDYDERKRIPDRFDHMEENIQSFEAPVVAEIDGLCLGGGLEVALACDFRIASERSQFGQPEVDFGLLPGGGGAQRLSMIVGVSRAKELCMTGKRIDAETAEEDGILTRTCPAEDLAEEVREFTETLADKPPLALRSIKEAADLTREVGFGESLQYGNRAWLSLAMTVDHQEAMEAFAADREAVWQGK